MCAIGSSKLTRIGSFAIVRSFINDNPLKIYMRGFLCILLIGIASCSSLKIPQPKAEFRGFWVATVVNIDWPKNGTDAVLKQQKDFLEILDFYDQMNFNAAIVQIRTAGDAFYKSDYAPSSRFLTGREGKFRENQESLLKWMIHQTHKRGMEFHAWPNPYRATFDLKTDVLSPIHDYNLHPEWMVRYGKKYYCDPGLPEVRHRMVQVIEEIVTNYDVDGIHFDDYFYPYTIQGEVFNDSTTFSQHHLPNQSLPDWRRANIDSLVQNSHNYIKEKKPWVQFGVSPFGVWKNKTTDPRGSDTQAGQTTYENLFADPLLWASQGWLDYLVPQVYWSMELSVASHRKIINWWAKNNNTTNLYIGNGPYKIRANADKAWDDPEELPRQLLMARKTGPVKGNVFFSAKSLMNDHQDIVLELQKKYYQYDALPPISSLAPEMGKNAIDLSILEKTADSLRFKFKGLDGFRYALVFKSGKRKSDEYSIKKLQGKTLVRKNGLVVFSSELLKKRRYVALSFIDFYGRETDPIIVPLKKRTSL